MAQDGAKGAGGRDAGAERRERLHGFLCELVAREGRMEAAGLLGVNYRTLVNAEESGELTGRMSDALERLLLTWDGGLGAGDSDAEPEPETEPDGGLARRVEALEVGLDDLAHELRSGLEAVRAAVAGAGQGDSAVTQGKPEAALAGGGHQGAPVSSQSQSPATALPATSPPPVPGLGQRRPARLRWRDPEMVTREPDDDDPEVYGDAWPLVQEWRKIKDRHPVRGSSLSWLEEHERLLTVELAMLEEHGLTLPPQKQPVKGLERRDHTRWRWKALYRTQVALHRRKMLRWVRRILTVGLWRK